MNEKRKEKKGSKESIQELNHVSRHSLIASYYSYNTMLHSVGLFAEKSHREYSSSIETVWKACSNLEFLLSFFSL
jgi:hypothetical protein